MGIFSKYEYKKIELPFYYIREKEDIEAGGFSIEAYGEINGQTQYFYASFILFRLQNVWTMADYNEMINILESAKNNSVELELKIKKGEIKGFTIDAKSLAHSLEDSRFGKNRSYFLELGKGK